MRCKLLLLGNFFVLMCYYDLSVVCLYGGGFHGDPGLRHISILKLVGMEAVDQGGVLELYPINGENPVVSTAPMCIILHTGNGCEDETKQETHGG